MIITEVEARCIKVPLPTKLYPAWTPGIAQSHLEACLVKIYTDEGIIGISGGIDFQGVVKKSIEDFVKHYLIGKDPFLLGNFDRVIKFSSFIGPRTYIVEIALWDLIGKALKAPIYRLLGGYKDRVKAYASTAEVKKAEDRIKDVKNMINEGFKAVKIRAHSENPEDDIKVVKALRDAFGFSIEIMVDANQAWSWTGPVWSYNTVLKVARELEKMEVSWLEEPLPKDNLEGLRRLRKEVNIPIAGGELEHGLYRFKELIEKDVYDIVQPDVTLSGGINEVKKIASLAESKNKLCIPHTWTHGLGLAANLQLIGSLSNCPFLEFPYEPPAWRVEVRDMLIKEPLKIDKDGYVNIPNKLGLGIELNEEIIEKYSVQ
ncbi:isomerase [Candidatus Acidianus copahuensis]|uniref:Isomerase n=1 Tax=Candidatus Acidianus copahuensis TaxID=1160895 RepID=A0A031LX57_9CREN|nr:mandelate racemase/muconate lactonizing enzyme family protein [Candidatus Acidianus copahuensis]EZQ11723.1 isomerase [Candidatus Acidianus copahuensis]